MRNYKTRIIGLLLSAILGFGLITPVYGAGYWFKSPAFFKNNQYLGKLDYEIDDLNKEYVDSLYKRASFSPLNNTISWGFGPEVMQAYSDYMMNKIFAAETSSVIVGTVAGVKSIVDAANAGDDFAIAKGVFDTMSQLGTIAGMFGPAGMIFGTSMSTVSGLMGVFGPKAPEASFTATQMKQLQSLLEPIYDQLTEVNSNILDVYQSVSYGNQISLAILAYLENEQFGTIDEFLAEGGLYDTINKNYVDAKSRISANQKAYKKAWLERHSHDIRYSTVENYWKVTLASNSPATQLWYIRTSSDGENGVKNYFTLKPGRSIYIGKYDYKESGDVKSEYSNIVIGDADSTLSSNIVPGVEINIAGTVSAHSADTSGSFTILSYVSKDYTSDDGRSYTIPHQDTPLSDSWNTAISVARTKIYMYYLVKNPNFRKAHSVDWLTANDIEY